MTWSNEAGVANLHIGTDMIETVQGRLDPRSVAFFRMILVEEFIHIAVLLTNRMMTYALTR
jgi:hypothetical protein